MLLDAPPPSRDDLSSLRASQSLARTSRQREKSGECSPLSCRSSTGAEPVASQPKESDHTLPYIVVDPIANKKADRILRAIRTHDYILQSPQHSKVRRRLPLREVLKLTRPPRAGLCHQ
eukprot:768344-Hanusia_phi.AAC.9